MGGDWVYEHVVHQQIQKQKIHISWSAQITAYIISQYITNVYIKVDTRTLAMSFIVMWTGLGHRMVHTVAFGTDAQPIDIDNIYTTCISNMTADLIDTLSHSNKTIKGFGGTRPSNLK